MLCNKIGLITRQAARPPLRFLGWALLGCLVAVGPVLADDGRQARGPVGGELPPAAVATALAAGDRLGGDGTQFGLPVGSKIEDMDIAANGDIYFVAVFDHPSDGEALAVYRSTDGGTTFQQWGTLTSPGTGTVYDQPRLIVAEGTQDRCFVAFTSNNTPGDDTVIVAWEDLASPTAAFAARTTVFAQAGDSFETPELAADDAAFSDYYLYLVGVGKDGNGHDIWFGRSNNQGTSWSSVYELAASPLATADYGRPSVSHGSGSFVHVAWDYTSSSGAFPGAIRYRRADNDAGAGLVDWGLLWQVTTTTNGYEDWVPRIVAAHDSDDVVLTYNRLIVTGSGTFSSSPVVRVAGDQGNLGFSASAELPLIANPPNRGVRDLVRSPVTGDWYASLDDSGRRIARAAGATPTAWSEYGQFQPQPPVNESRTYYSSSIAVDPTRGNRLALVLTAEVNTGAPEGVFNAEWQADPGHPILESGFPFALQVPPASDPALVDLNGDGDLEIIFGDEEGNIRAIEAVGTELPGWPVDTGSLSDSPIACGKLTIGDEMYVVAGTTDGFVYAFLADGSIAPGWPVDLGTAAPAHVSIGALGGPFPLTIVVGSGPLITYLDYAGRQPLTGGRNYGSNVATEPCAIGDIDNDGKAEIVYAMGLTVYAHERSGPYEINAYVGGVLSDQITMGDIDLDGDLEIAVPNASGWIYLLDHTGAIVPGWPFISGDSLPMRSASWANVLGSNAPELALTTKSWKLHLLDGSGVEQAGFPVNAGFGWYQYGSPVIGQIDGFFPDILLGSDGSNGWAFNVLGNEIPGWPRQLGAPCQWTPAIGDIDLDGSNEVVLLTNTGVHVFDVRSAPLPPELTWLMAGHGPQRTGCSDCTEDLVSAVDDALAPTRLAFAAPYPNPASARTALSYALPAAAQVKLQIFDVRGHLVRTLADGKKEAGRHEVVWNGTHANGRRVALGLYLARLSVNGPGVQEQRVQKISLVR